MGDRNVFRVSGIVVDRRSRRGAEGLRVEAWDKDLICSDLVGSVTTDKQGAFRIEFAESYFRELFLDRRPDLFFRVYRERVLIKSTEDSVLWNVGAGSTEVTIEVDLPLVGEMPTLPALSLTGTVVNAISGFPLSGLSVAAYVVDSIARKDADRAKTATPESRVGEAETDASGHFTIAFDITPDAQERLRRLASPDAALQLKVFAPEGNEYHVSAPLSAASGSIAVTLPVSLPDAAVTSKTWESVGTQLEEARITQIHELVRQLAFAPSGQTIFDDWNLEQRQAVLVELEQAFLDPRGVLRKAASPLPGFQEMRVPGVLESYSERISQHADEEVRRGLAELRGKLQSFSSLADVDWPMDLDAFRNGDPGTAMDAFSDVFRSRFGMDAPPGLSDRFPETTLSQYRDYLLAVWTGFITRLSVGGGSAPSRNQALEQLANRFHQAFTTADTKPTPASELMIDLVRNILLHPTGSGFGFGLAAAAIPPRGTESARDYLTKLIALSGLSSREFGLRYRIDLDRPDSALSNPVQENIATLQDFYKDTFQCPAEPFSVQPDVFGQPIVPNVLQGKAPFFLQYEEWLRRQSPFYAENFYSVLGTVYLDLSQKNREDIVAYATPPGPPVTVTETPQEREQKRIEWQFISDVVHVHDLAGDGHYNFGLGEYPKAKEKYSEAAALADRLLHSRFVDNLDKEGLFLDRKQVQVTSLNQLQDFYRKYAVPRFNQYTASGSTGDLDVPRLDPVREGLRDAMAFALLRHALYVLPTCLGDVALAMGDYSTATLSHVLTTRFPVGIASGAEDQGYPVTAAPFYLYRAGELAYTVQTRKAPFEYDGLPVVELLDAAVGRTNSRTLLERFTHPVEARFFRLRQGNAMLEWADSLYRTDDASNIVRARELYKGVLWLHGSIPPIGPNWLTDPALGLGSAAGSEVRFGNSRTNPALTTQLARARLGFFKIEARLNYFGERNDVVPALRYRPLKESADRFCALARTTQWEFLLYIEKVESAVIERMKLSNLLQKASLQASVADQQIELARYQQSVAEQQVVDIQAAIDAKIKEITDADSFTSQFGEYVGGLVKTFTAMPDATKSAVGAGYTSEFTKEELVGQGMFGGGAGASVATGFGAFFVASYMSMSSMVEASNRRANDLAALRDKALPAAQGLVEARKREVTIAGFVRQIAQADIDLARDLIGFEENRFLNVNLWASLAQIARRMLARYLDLGARVSWLAERALDFELDRDIRIVRFDYFPEKFQGVTGANLLEADLAELEATRIEGIKSTVPVKHTFSLVRDFPLQFGQLKRTGTCAFRTEELPMRIAYPGTSSYRVRAISIAVPRTTFGNPFRGLLLNRGISISRPGQPGEHVLVRPSEAMPISEFNLAGDMAVYSLPDETLLTFEGSGVETFWELRFPRAANPNGLNGLADVMITFDLRARYFPDLYSRQLASMPTTVRRWVLVSAARQQAQAVKDLTGAAASATFDYDLNNIGLPRDEAKGKVKNIAVVIVSEPAVDARMVVSAARPSNNIPVQLQQGVAMSNVPPTSTGPSPTPQPLDKLLDFDVRQRFSVAVNKAQNSGVDFSGVSDVLLAVEYEADLT